MSTLVDHIEVRWRPSASQGVFQTQKIPASQGTVTIPSVERGVSYDVEARSVSARGTASDWVPVQHTVALANLPLGVPTGLTSISLADGVHLAWVTGDTQLRADTEFEVWRAPDSSGSPGTFALLTTLRGTAYTDGVTDGVLRWYEVREKDQQGNYSAFTAAVSSAGKTVANGATNGFTSSPNLLLNPTGALGTQYWGAVGTGNISQYGVITGFRFQGNSGAASGLEQSISATLAAGTTFALGGDMNASGITGGALPTLNIVFLNSVGGVLSTSTVTATQNASWTRYFVTAAAPANTASMQVQMLCGVPSGGGTPMWRRLKLEYGPVSTPFDDLGTQVGNQLVQPGSGLQLGDKRNLPQSAVNNISSYYSANSLTWSATLSSGVWSGSISSAAFNAIYDGNSIAYNASSVNLTYSGPGGAVQYWVYFDDPTHAGGTPALVATTTQSDCFASAGRVYMGSVSVNWPSAAGTNTGGYTLTGSKWSRVLMITN